MVTRGEDTVMSAASAETGVRTYGTTLGVLLDGVAAPSRDVAVSTGVLERPHGRLDVIADTGEQRVVAEPIVVGLRSGLGGAGRGGVEIRARFEPGGCRRVDLDGRLVEPAQREAHVDEDVVPLRDVRHERDVDLKPLGVHLGQALEYV